ncbi:2,3-bisphosphoglycerate-independent phosphoglycerate mutase [Candidatus Dojkabacteria bacterium]|uniref:2,3-bisphosphoglycerate-independent phosphoglycerate mutase n=1 Tax=Candidatus Dojkabacteria bacterium TaxID=2099670 RepID=A0A955RH89_9BACT|nr:2,3-bisphosphoglycerate-independent phosphoglycerate mutase [Candidatus Dojkabacteria bacterium]
MNKKVVMLILDGWGLGKEDEFNAIANAKTPNFDKLVKDYPNIRLKSDGPAVGLPEGQFGTSEINHQVIGAGTVILQDLPRISKYIEEGSFFNNKGLVEACNHAKKNNSAVQLVGIVSDGNVHASMEHLQACIDLVAREGVENIYIHAFTDGRDTPPKSAKKYLDQVEKSLKKHKFNKASISTMQGRFYLDRDRDWDKTEKAVNLIFEGRGGNYKSYETVINDNYYHNNTDEYFEQYVLDEEGIIGKKDSIIFFHFRTDRMYQLAQRISQRVTKNNYMVSFTSYSDDFKFPVAFPREYISHTLASTVSEAKKSQLHITETEKFAHLTFFMNAGKEEEYPYEDWKMLQSNRYVKPYYNFEPSMRAFDITDQIVDHIEKDSYDFIVVNYPNTDMVGHTGNYEAAVIAAESVDYCLGKVYAAIKEKLDDYVLIVTADHGNSDVMWDYESEQPHTQHTTNPVPFILVTDIKCKLDRKESLEDIAPTILDLMGIEKPEVMKGNTLIVKE